MNKYYDLNDYNITIETSDSIFYFSEGNLLIDGKIMANPAKFISYKKKELIFYTKGKSVDVFQYVMDSLGDTTGQVKISKEGIYSIEHFDLKAHGKDSHIIYSDTIDS